MESYLERRKEDLIKTSKKTNDQQLNSLIQEYCLKRGQFNPKKNSRVKEKIQVELRIIVLQFSLYILYISE